MIRNLKWHVFIRTIILEVLTVYKADETNSEIWFFCAVICSMCLIMDIARLFMEDED